MTVMLSPVTLLCFLQDFGLDVDTFQQMVEDCPPEFLKLAITCCNVRNTHPGLLFNKQIAEELYLVSLKVFYLFLFLSDECKAPSVLFRNRVGAGEEAG